MESTMWSKRATERSLVLAITLYWSNWLMVQYLWYMSSDLNSHWQVYVTQWQPFAMPVQGQLNPQTVQEKIQMMAGLPINILGIRLTTVHHCRWSLFVRMKHFHMFYSLKVEWVNRLLCPSNRWKVTLSLFLGCLQKEIGNQIQNNTFLQYFTHFLDALASLDLKLSVSESVIYRFQLAHLRVFQIIFDFSTFCVNFC